MCGAAGMVKAFSRPVGWPGFPRCFCQSSDCILLPLQSVPHSNSSAMPHCNFFPPATPPPLANQTVERGGQCGQQSVWAALPSSGLRPTPNTTWALASHFHSALGSSHTSPWQAGLLWIQQYPWPSWCGRWSTAQTRWGCASDRRRTYWLS